MSFLLNSYILGSAGGGIPLPITANFLTATYEVQGSAVTAADLIDKPGLVGVSGLTIDDNEATGVVEAIGDLQTALLSLDWTLVIEWESLDSSFQTYLIVMKNTAQAFNDLHIQRQSSGNGLDILAQDSTSVTTREIEDATDNFGTGVHKVAITRTDAVFQMSVDGNAVVTNSTSLANAFDNIGLGGEVGEFPSNSFYIRLIELTSAVASSELPTLSTV